MTIPVTQFCYSSELPNAIILFKKKDREDVKMHFLK